MTLIDYSAARLNGSAVKAAGHTGAVRYVTAPNLRAGKHITPAEYKSYVSAGLQVLLVFEQHTNDAAGGRAGGIANAKLALAGANELGYKGPIFFCNDTPALASVSLWRAYLDGAASVLGKARVGAYGFANAMDAAQGHATYFWQAGREADVRSFVHLYQWNNGRVYVSGIECDLNKIRKPISSGASTVAAAPTVEDDMTPDDLWNSRFSWVSRQDGKTYVSTFHQYAQATMQLSESYNPGRANVGPAGTMSTYLSRAMTGAEAAANKSVSVTVSPADLKVALAEALKGAPAVDAEAIATAVAAKFSQKLGG